MEQKAKTRALLAAFGCALTYLLAGKVLAFLPAPAWDVRALSFVHHCIAAPVVEELVFRGGHPAAGAALGQRAGRGAAGGNVCGAARHPGGHGVGAWLRPCAGRTS